MMRKLSVLLGIAAVVTATTSWKDGVPRYASKKGRPHIAPGKQHRRLHQSRKAIVSQTSPLRERARQPSKHSATTVSRYHRAAAASSSGIAPPLLPAEELETLKALYHSLSGPDWHIKDGWMSASNPCCNGTINTTWYGVECAIFDTASGLNSTSHIIGLVLPQNSLVGKLPPFNSLRHLLHLDFSNSDLPEVSNDFGNVVSGTLVTLCGLGNLSTILLASNNFTGSIPDCIQSLANATVLDLNFNSIQGTTPDEICHLRNLEELHLRGNRLEGTVPECIGEALTALRVLDYGNHNFQRSSIGDQSLSGTLPASLCNLEHLEHLSFQATQGLHGNLPDCLGAKQPQLQFLELEVNQFQGALPLSLCQASALKHLYLFQNALTGTVPSCLGSLSQLTDLDLDTNQFYGPIPEELCQLSTLKELFLFENALTGTVPSCLGSLSQLTQLGLNTNQFHGPIPEELCQASVLELLTLAENALTGTVPSCLGSLSQLTQLGLNTNQFHGPIPEELCQASALEDLVLFENALTGTIPSCLGSLSQLTWLDLSINQLHGPIPEELCQASALEYLVLFENALTGTVPSCLGSLSQLTQLGLNTNQFHGPIPEELCQLRALEYLILAENALMGTVPICLGSLSQLILLELAINQFHGPIPEELCQLSALEYLTLKENALTGTIPSCLGSLSQLNDLELAANQFHGPIPEELCKLSALEFLLLQSNTLTGSLPRCLAKSFPLLQVMLLHDNDFAGPLPLEWALPSLVSITLSNNPRLSGSLPFSLFLQYADSNVSESSRSPNEMLRAVVVEGTSIGGTLPAALCSAPQLATLAFSGNELTGSIPGCVTSMQYLQTFRASNNHLNGTLPVAINNMTSLSVLDLSTNEIQGRIPTALGDISPNLDTVQLQLNRLSCDLPASVLDWQVSSENVSFNLLDGNLFGCGSSTFLEIFALSIQGAAGLRNANEQAFDAYSCGSSTYVLPMITVTILAVPVAFGLFFMAFRGRLALQWRIALEWMVNPSTLINELDYADKQLRNLALSVIVAALLAGSVALGLSMNVAKSVFDCEYMAAPTLANKGGSNARSLSISASAAVCAGLVLGLFLWWRRLVTKCSSSRSYDYGGIVAENNKLIYPLEEDAEAWDFDAERTAEAAPQKQAVSCFTSVLRALKLMVLSSVLLFLTIGPNIGYVLVALSHQLTQEQKLASELAVTLAKTAIGTMLVPRVARKAVDMIILNGALAYVRFRLRLVIATALSAISMVVLPVSIVLVTDPRCFYYIIKPQPAVGTDVPYLYCSIADYAGICTEYATSTVISTYTPSFAYDGESCVSAVLSVYGPVFLGVVLLAASLPAGMEIFTVPWLAPWCYRNAESSTAARTGLAFLRAMTWNVWPALANAGVLPPDFSLGAAKLDYLAQRVVERAFVQVMTTLLVALTFGIAVPVVGGACAVAAFVQLLHHRHVLGQIVSLGRLEQPTVVPNLMGCTDIPVSCAVVVVATVVLVWVCGIVGYLDPAVIGCMLVISLMMALAACGIAALWQRSRSKAPSQHQDRAQSTASSDTSRGMLMESLLAEDEITERK